MRSHGCNIRQYHSEEKQYGSVCNVVLSPCWSDCKYHHSGRAHQKVSLKVIYWPNTTYTQILSEQLLRLPKNTGRTSAFSRWQKFHSHFKFSYVTYISIILGDEYYLWGHSNIDCGTRKLWQYPLLWIFANLTSRCFLHATNLAASGCEWVDNVFSLVNKINVIIGGMPLFKRYFLHVGFQDN